MKASLAPTPLIAAESVPPITIAAQPTIRRAASFALFWRLLGFGLRFGWNARVRKASEEEQALSARAFIEGLGGLWIKAGQLLSLRIDLLSKPMADQLSQLTFRSYGFDPAVARAVVEQELGRSIEQVFDEFEDAPFAAASISQLHRARLRGRRGWVAVKVQRPGMELVMRRDLGLITWFLRRMKSVRSVNYISWDGMILELQRMMQEEVDYRFEVANMRRMRKLLKAHHVVVPRVHRELCTRRVIVMEYLPGVVLADYLRVQRSDPDRIAAWHRENDVSPRKVGRRIVQSFYRQMYEEPLFHGDLHPGNIMLLRESRFALIDFGAVGSLEKKFLNAYGAMARAIATGDYAKAMELYLLLCDDVPAIDLNAYRAEAVDATRNWEMRTHLDGLTYLERSISGGLSTELTASLRKYRINPSWQFLRVTRSVGALDANLGVLLGDINPAKVLRGYFEAKQRRDIKALGQHAFGRIANTVANAAETAGQVSELIRKQTIRLQGTRGKAAQIAGVLAGFIQFLIALVGIVLIYDFLHDHLWNLVAGIDPGLAGLGDFVTAIPPIPTIVELALIVADVVLFFAVGRIRRIAFRKLARLPNGTPDR